MKKSSSFKEGSILTIVFTAAMVAISSLRIPASVMIAVMLIMLCLKLSGVCAIPWLVVTLPLWLPLLMLVIGCAILAAFLLLMP